MDWLIVNGLADFFWDWQIGNRLLFYFQIGLALMMDWHGIDIWVQCRQIVGILIKDCQLFDVLTMDWQRIGIGTMCECRIGKLLQTNSGIGHGQTLDWE